MRSAILTPAGKRCPALGLDDAGLPDIVWERIAESGEVTLETKPPRTFTVTPFWIARYAVTWAQYRAFIDAADGYQDARWWDGLKLEEQPGDPLWAFANHPAINVSWYDAMAFCRWLSARFALEQGEQVRLPTEWEWQWVAQSCAARLPYPWGEDWNAARTNSDQAGLGRTVAVGLYPLGGPAGRKVMDLEGNVLEWCLNEYRLPEMVGLAGQGAWRVLRGCSWLAEDPDECRAASRQMGMLDYRGTHVGFRVCRGVPVEPKHADAR